MLTMKGRSSTLKLSMLLFLFAPFLVTSQTCKTSCGGQLIKYPFGTGAGCGNPRFQTRVVCENNQQLTFITHTGHYPITSIDYSNQFIYVTDPTMSTCSCSQPSKGFSLDWDAPFTFQEGTVFALLDCSISSSPIYNNSNGNSSASPVCDYQAGASICSLLNSCLAISMISVPISTCCLYTPVDLGPSFEMDLQKLQCKSYSGLYSFNGQEKNPQSWKYGVALKYKFNFDNQFPEVCDDCEKSNGVCGYNGPFNSFACYCPNGLNTTRDCFFAHSWSSGYRNHLPWQTGALSIYSLAWIAISSLV